MREQTFSKLRELSEKIYKSAKELRYILIWSIAVIVWLGSLLPISYQYTTIEDIPGFIWENWLRIGGVLGIIGVAFTLSNYRMIKTLKEYETVYFVNTYISVFENIKPPQRLSLKYFENIVEMLKFIFPITKHSRVKITLKPTSHKTHEPFEVCIRNVKTEIGEFVLFITRLVNKIPINSEKMLEIKNKIKNEMRLQERTRDYLRGAWVRIIIISTSGFDKSALEFAQREEDYIFDLIEEKKNRYHVIYVGEKSL